jgi:hypothetical protein
MSPLYLEYIFKIFCLYRMSNKTPYLKVSTPKLMRNGPRSTVFGAIGAVEKDRAGGATLGGLILDSKVGKLGKGTSHSVGAYHHNTDRHILCSKAKTSVPGVHYGQVPYAGYFRSVEGKRL